MRGVILALAVLTGCVAAPEPVSYRDQSVPIASQVDVAANQLIGNWQVRESFPLAGQFYQTELSYDLVSNGALRETVSVSHCLATTELEACNAHEWPDVLVPLGSGRFRSTIMVPDAAGPARSDVWILWADADRRTLAIGTPDGSFGFILDRNPTGGEDRIATARDVMAGMGYRVEEMVP